jgi:hypothetical protein
METPNFNKDLKKLKELKLPQESYAIFGSGPLAIRGIRDSKDLDILVKKELYGELKKRFPQDTSKHTFNCLAIGNIEIGDNWQGDQKLAEKLISTSEKINNIPFVKLEEVIKFKKELGREKDIKDLKLIEEYPSEK